MFSRTRFRQVLWVLAFTMASLAVLFLYLSVNDNESRKEGSPTEPTMETTQIAYPNETYEIVDVYVRWVEVSSGDSEGVSQEALLQMFERTNLADEANEIYQLVGSKLSMNNSQLQPLSGWENLLKWGIESSQDSCGDICISFEYKSCVFDDMGNDCRTIEGEFDREGKVITGTATHNSSGMTGTFHSAVDFRAYLEVFPINVE